MSNFDKWFCILSLCFCGCVRLVIWASNFEMESFANFIVYVCSVSVAYRLGKNAGEKYAGEKYESN